MEHVLDPYIEQIMNSYYRNNAKKLHEMVNQIFFRKYGGIAKRDMDEFYSVANDVFTDIIKHERYDSSKGDFEGFLYKALSLAMVDEFKRQNRDKRATKITIVDENGNQKRISLSDVYLDAPIGEDGNATIGDSIQADFDIDAAISKDREGFQDERIQKYLDHLPNIQRKIIEMKMEEVPIAEIKKRLRLSDNQYNQHCMEIKSFANISILFAKTSKVEYKEDDETMGTTQTMENCKTDKISISSIIKKIDKHTIRFDHPLQRDSEQWTPAMKGNLVSDILQGNKLHPLIFAEQIINGVPIIWDLDGKQRCTNAYSFSVNGYKVSKNIRRWLIKYQTTKKDENGEDILDENGFPVAINAEFDIRGKSFSDLPEELKDKFLDYSFNYDQYLNCSEEDIGYHIERYNDGKPMTASQKGSIKLGCKYAETVKSISSMSFFRDMGGYKVSEFKNGTINRVIVESIMASFFLDKWKKDHDYQCKYIRDNATQDIFDNFEDMVRRIEKVVTEDVADMFDSKDSFLWFGLFAKFTKMGVDDNRFIEFMAEFDRSLHNKEVDGKTFDNLSINEKGKTRATKDNYIVADKMKLLEKLLVDFLRTEITTYEDLHDIELFVSENLDMDIEAVHDDIDLYIEALDDLSNNTIKLGSKLLDNQNRPSLLAMVVYSFKEDADLDEWMKEYAECNDTYYPDQKKNYLHMKEDFERFIKKCA